jgi:acetolactate synthase-1/2/3 large subunit
MGREADAEVYADPGFDRFPATRVRPSREAIEAAARLLAAARRPVLIAGGGVIISRAWDQVLELAERYDIPVATTMTGRGTIADAHPLSVGVLGSSTGGRYGRGRVANRILAEADLAFILGSRTGQICYSDWTLPKPTAKVVHLDIDPLEPGRNFRTHVTLVGDVRETLVDLLDHCRTHDVRVEVETTPGDLETLRAEWRRVTEPLATSSQIPIHPERLLREISDLVDTGTVLVTDASYVTGWAMSQIESVGRGAAILSPRGTGGLGWGLPAALGAKLADPGKTVICLTGDGGFGYVLGELETAARYRIKVVVVVFNNGTLAFQKHYEEKLFGKAVECDLLDVDYAEVGRALYCGGERVTAPEAIRPALRRALAAPGPYVLDVVIDPTARAPIVGLGDSAEPTDSH